MFFPKKSKINDMIVEHASIVTDMARLFDNAISSWNNVAHGYTEIKTLENKADTLVHVITAEVDNVFILPFDKEDIRELIELMDDIADNLEEVVNRIKIYKIQEGNTYLAQFSGLLLQAIEQIYSNIHMIQRSKMFNDDFTSGYTKLHDLESQGDELHRQVLEKLMGNGSPEFDSKDPIAIMKWKEIFQTLENTLDTCEDIAIVLERLKIKYR
jgi:hypothetical protein